MKKTLTMSLAALGVAGMISGGTFAVFSDQVTIEDNEIAGGTVELELAAGQNAANPATPFSASNVAPKPAWADWMGDTDDLERSDRFDRRIYVGKNVGSVNANLSMRFTNVNTDPDPSDFDNQLYLAVGEVPDDAVARHCHPFDFASNPLVNASDPTDTWNLDDPRPLADVVDIDWLFPLSNPLEPFDPTLDNAACVRIDAHFPGQEGPAGDHDNNDVQGHEVSFDTQFDLIQDL